MSVNWRVGAMMGIAPFALPARAAADEIRFTRKGGDFATEEFVARRMKD